MERIMDNSFSKFIESKIDVLVDSANVRYADGDLKGAMSDLSDAITLKPDYREALHGRGILKFMLNDKQGAIVDLTATLELNWYDAEALFYRGKAYLELGEMDKAKEDIRDAKLYDYPVPQDVLDKIG
jgi:Flp pilus assembly protein TadD